MKDKSAERVAVATEKTEESADRRTVLAANRTVFAAERTYAASVRTGLAALASGVGAKAALGHVMNEQPPHRPALFRSRFREGVTRSPRSRLNLAGRSHLRV
jgi:hypothetical protein